MAGGFAWTGFDYKGEPTPYDWPCINSNFGVIDIAGFPKDTFWYYQSWWINKTVLHVFPHWNKPESGLAQPVWVYSNAASVELFINGASQGKQQMPQLDHVEWATQWVSGAIRVVAYDAQGTVVATQTIETTGAPAAIVLEVEYGSDGIYADKQDVALIKASIVDSAGRTVPTASNKITFEVSNLGRLIGVGNGDPSSHEPDKANYRSAFNGLARAVVQSTVTVGIISVTASAEGLKPGLTTIKTMAPKFTHSKPG